MNLMILNNYYSLSLPQFCRYIQLPTNNDSILQKTKQKKKKKKKEIIFTISE